MPQTIDTAEAIKHSLQTEKNARDFYRLGARHMKNEGARKTFELLAREEEEHARWFYDAYTGSDLPPFDTFMAVDPSKDSDWLSSLEKETLKKLDERRAMKLALDKELELEKNLRELAEKISESAAKAVFVKNADSTHNHYLLIESEYARLMGMVHESDMDTFVRE